MDYITQQDNKINIEELLAEGKTVKVSPKGYSMYPLMVPGRDYAIIEPYKGGAKRCDVALFRRQGSILVIHRIYSKTDEGYFFVGDNQHELEGPIKEEQIKGIMVCVERKGHMLSCSNVFYRMVYHIWLWMLPVRTPLRKFVAKVKLLITKKS